MLLSELRFAAHLAYSVRGDDEPAARSRFWRAALKGELAVGTPRRPMSQLFAERLFARFDETPFLEHLPRSAVLVPVPSSRLQRAASLWVPFRLAKALVAVGLGRAVEPCLERSDALPKAAWSNAENRPTARRHYETLRVRRLMFAPEELVLIDDVITRGATLLGAASRLCEAFPRARITAFAAMRAISERESFHEIFDPCIGSIELREDGSTVRRP